MRAGARALGSNSGTPWAPDWIGLSPIRSLVPCGVTRRLMVDGFPYDVVYRAHVDAIEVLALAHHRRRPGYWRRRV